MTYIFNPNLELLSVIEESSFSYSKKAGKEGGGTITIQSLLPSDAFYISLYSIDDDEKEYITSGVITEYVEENQGYSFRFKTFESLLKNYIIPKKWNNYKKLLIPQIVADLMFGFRPIYKTSKADLGVLNSTNPTYLMSENIAFNAIEGADLTLAFDGKKKSEENVYYYCENGFVIFQYDLGEPNFLSLTYAEDEAGQYKAHFPLRVLRWSEQVGEKTFVKWKAIEKDKPVTSVDNALLEELKNAPVLQARRDEKKSSIEEGVPLPCMKRVLILQLIFEYIKADYVLDFNTQEINPKASKEGKKVKRTVRGFTPIVHGFEILNRCPLTPFSLAKDASPSETLKPVRTILEVAGNLNKHCNTQEVKFDGAKVCDVLSRMQELYNFNIAFDLRNDITEGKAQFYISMFSDEAIGKVKLHGKDLRYKEEAWLKAVDEDGALSANFNLAKMKKKVELPILLDCKGEDKKGSSNIDSLRFVFYINYVFVDGAYKREVFVYGADGVDKSEFGELKAQPVSEAWIDKIKVLPYIQETLEVKDAKTPSNIADAVLKYLVDKENKVKAETFEATVFQDVRLYDCVRVLHAKSGKAYDVFIKEEKIRSKNGKITKSVGLAGDIYNPFDCLFAKKRDVPIITHPTMPTEVKVNSHKDRLRIEWLPHGVYDEFLIKIERRDGVCEEGWEVKESFKFGDKSNGLFKIKLAGKSQRFLSTTNKFLEVNTLSVNTIYSVSISSCYEEGKSEYTKPIYFKMEDSNSHIRYLENLNEKGEDGDEAYFYDEYLAITQGRSLRNYSGWDYKLFNSIEQVIKEPCSIEYKTIAEGNVKYLPKPIPYKEYPICEYFGEYFYETVYPCFGKYYIWRAGKWRERRYVVPSMPIFFFDLEEKAFPNIKDVAEYKDFCDRWKKYCAAVYSYQKTRENINRALAYNKYKGVGNKPPNKNSPQPYSSFHSGSKGYPFPLPPNPNPGPIMPPKDPEVQPLPELPPATPTQEAQLIDWKQALEAVGKYIQDILNKTYLGRSGTAIINTFKEKDFPIIYDASSREHHLDYRVIGGELLTDVSVDANSFSGSDTKPYYLQHAFNFIYTDLDNGGDKNTKIETSFDERIKEHRHPFYQKKDIPFLSESINTPFYTDSNLFKSSGRRDFTFSCWVNISSATENVFLWDVSGFCLAYVKDGKLHIGHREIVRKVEEEDGWTWTPLRGSGYGSGEADPKEKDDKDSFEYLVKDFLVYDWKKGSPYGIPPSPSYFHVMIECRVFKTYERDMTSIIHHGEQSTYCKYTINHNIYINFKQVPSHFYEERTNTHTFSCKYNKEKTIDEIKKDWQEEFRSYPSLSDEELKKYYERKYWLESFPSLRIAYFEPKPKMPYIFKQEQGQPCKFTKENDLTDYSCTSYDFTLSHLMLFEGILTKLEKYYLREYGIYPIKHLPTKVQDAQGGQSSQGGGSSGNNQGYNPNGYLGIVNVAIGKDYPKIKTLRCGEKTVIANNGEFILMAIDCKHFKAGHLYKWIGSEWIELTPFIQYLQEAKDAFNDIKQLPKVAQNYFYKEFATFGIAICNGLFSSTVMTDALTVIGNVSMMNLPEIDPHKKGALYTRNGVLRISLG